MISQLRSAFLLLLALSSTGPLLAWDFSPKEARTFVDGPTPRHFYMVGGDRKINLRIDLDTKLVGTSESALFTFGDANYATMKLAQSPLHEKKPPFAENLPLYRETAQKRLPAGSTDIVLLGESEDVFPINDWTSHQFTFKYANYGRPFQTSITFLNYNAKEQWIIDISSKPENFESITGRAGNILNTINETDLSYKLEDAPN